MRFLFAALILAAVIISGPASAQSSFGGDVLFCSGHPWYDVRCPTVTDPVSNVSQAISSPALGDGSHNDGPAIQAIGNWAVTYNRPVHFAAGTYKANAALSFDYAGIAGSGLQIISEDAVIDATAVASGVPLRVFCSGGTVGTPAACQGLRISGNLSLNVNTPAYGFELGNPDFSDKHSAAKIERLIVTNNSGSANAGGARINFVAHGSDLTIHGIDSGGSASVGAVAIEKLRNSRLSGSGDAAGASAAALLVENADSTGNMIAGFSYGLIAANTCLSITSATAKLNTFLSPDLSHCATSINAPASANGNVLLAPTLGGNTPLSSGIAVVGRGGLNRNLAPATSTYTAAGADDGSILSSSAATGAAVGWAAASIAVALPNPASVGAGWTMGFVTDAGKAVVLTPSAGHILGGGQSLSTLTVGPRNYEAIVLESDGANYRVVWGSPAMMALNGMETGGYPGRIYEFPGGPGYQVTQGDNGTVVSADLTGSGLAVTLPSTTTITAGWTIGIEGRSKTWTLQVNGVSGAQVTLPSGRSVSSFAMPVGTFALLQYDGANFRLRDLQPSMLHVPTNAALKALPGGIQASLIRDGFTSAGDGGSALYVYNTSNCTAADDGAQVAAPDGGCWKTDISGGARAELWGAVGDGLTNNTAKIQAALNAMAGGCNLRFGKGTFKASSALSYTPTDSGTACTIEGDGADQTQLRFDGGTQGLTFNFVDKFNSVHLRHFSLTACTTGGGTALSLIQLGTLTNEGVSAASDITGVRINGCDGPNATDYFNRGIYIQGVSLVNIDDLNWSGANAGSGDGIVIDGSAIAIPVVINLAKSSFTAGHYGLVLGDYVQGVTVLNSNFTGVVQGIRSTGTNLTTELTVTNGQFAAYDDAISVSGNLGIVMVTGNLFYVPVGKYGVHVNSSTGGGGGLYTVTGNTFAPVSLSSKGTGVYAQSNGTTAGGVISGNIFENLLAGINIGADASGWTIGTNSYIGNTGLLDYSPGTIYPNSQVVAANLGSPLAPNGGGYAGFGTGTLSTESKATMVLPYKVRLQNLTVNLSAAPGGTGQVVVIVRVNFVNTGLQCIVGPASQVCTSVANAEIFANAGDLVDASVTNDVASANSTIPTLSMQMDKAP